MRKPLKFLALLLSITISASGLTPVEAVSSPEQLSASEETEKEHKSDSEKKPQFNQQLQPPKLQPSEQPTLFPPLKKSRMSESPYSAKPLPISSLWNTLQSILFPTTKKSRPSESPYSVQPLPTFLSRNTSQFPLFPPFKKSQTSESPYSVQPTMCPSETEEHSETYVPKSQSEDISELLPDAVFLTEEQSERFLQLHQPWELKTQAENPAEELQPILPEQSALKEHPEAYISESQFGDTPKLFSDEPSPTEQTFEQLAQSLELLTPTENPTEKSQSEDPLTEEHAKTEEHPTTETYSAKEKHPAACTQNPQPGLTTLLPVKKISETIWSLCTPKILPYNKFLFKFIMPRSTFTSEEIESASAQSQEILRSNRENNLIDLLKIIERLNLKTDDSDNSEIMNALILCVQLLNLRENYIKILNRSDLIYLLAVSRYTKDRNTPKLSQYEQAPEFFDVNKVYVYYNNGKLTISCYLNKNKVYYSTLGHYIKIH